MKIRHKLKEGIDGGIVILNDYELMEKINQLKTKRDRAFVSFLYLTGCRVSEVCHYIIEANHKRKTMDKTTKLIVPNPIETRERKGSPLKKKQIQINEEEGIIKVYNVRSLKRRQTIHRTIPIFIQREKPFVNLLLNYLDDLEDEQYLFPFTRQRAYQILERVELYNHYLRHLRLTKLATDYGFTSAELKQFVNWGSSKSADSYIHLNVQNLIDKMKK